MRGLTSVPILDISILQYLTISFNQELLWILNKFHYKPVQDNTGEKCKILYKTLISLMSQIGYALN